MNSPSPSLARLAALCAELESKLPAEALHEISRLAYGRTLSELKLALLNASDPTAICAAAELLAANEAGCACSGDEPPEPTSAHMETAADRLTQEALAPFTLNPALRDYVSSLGCRLELPAADYDECGWLQSGLPVSGGLGWSADLVAVIGARASLRCCAVASAKAYAECDSLNTGTLATVAGIGSALVKPASSPRSASNQIASSRPLGRPESSQIR